MAVTPAMKSDYVNKSMWQLLDELVTWGRIKLDDIYKYILYLVNYKFCPIHYDYNTSGRYVN